MNEEDEAFDDLAKRQGDWGLQGSRKHQIMRYLENNAMREVQRLGQEIEQEPLEYWNAVEGWVKIDEVRKHFNSVGCGTIYKSAGEGRVPLCLAQPEQEPVAQCTESDSWNCKYCRKTESCKALQDPRNFASPPQRTEPVIDKSAAIRIATTLGWTPPRTWVGLTDEEFQWVYDHGRTPAGMMEMVEAKLKERNQ